MTREGADRDLRERFSALRREDREEAPAFARVWNAARSRGRARGGRLAILGFLTAAGVVALVVATIPRIQPPAPPRRHPGAKNLVPSITAWTPPTDFLLRTPGREVLGTLPRIGRNLPGYPVAPRIDGSAPPKERRSST